MVLVWLLSLVRRNASIVDVFWGLGFVGLAWLYFALGPQGAGSRPLLLLGLVTLWGLRLALHILWRNWGHQEDYRYRAMREHHGERFWWVSLFTIFFLQGLLLWIISAPFFVVGISLAQPGWTGTDVLGLLFWGVGFFFETVGDWQLARFKANPANRGQVMRKGLWAYTRHPNYFGDAMVWWGYFFLVLAVPAGIWTVVSPLLMTLLLLKVSGVALLEQTITERRPEYRECIESTNAFLPWFPRQHLLP
jgi:steroid 5-alpha reductase family enzyme